MLKINGESAFKIMTVGRGRTADGGSGVGQVKLTLLHPPGMGGDGLKGNPLLTASSEFGGGLLKKCPWTDGGGRQ
jgi:hypothetical protein